MAAPRHDTSKSNSKPISVPAPIRSSIPTASYTPALTFRPIPAPCPPYHPQFSSPKADIVLSSSEGTLYRIPSFTLRTTSGLFRTMFTLPQPHNENNNRKDTIIPTYTPAHILLPFLLLLSGLPPTPPISTLSLPTIEHLLTLSENWDTPGPLSTLLTALTAPRFLTTHPLALYRIFTHFSWLPEARLASTHTLTLPLHDPKHAAELELLSGKDLLRLLTLHRRRRDEFRRLLDSPERFTAGNASIFHCARCGVAPLDNSAWRRLKHAMFEEMDRRPLGDTISGIGLGPGMEGVATGMAEWPEARKCWEATCVREECRGLNYDMVGTLKQIRNCVELLPAEVEN